jgi:hypothetical protein
MSEQGFKNIPGVPEGWELVHCLRIGEPGEIGLNQLGEPFAIGPNRTIKKVPIIRKIEVPKKYRPFKGDAEYMASSQRGVAADWSFTEAHGFYAVVSANASFVWVAFGDKIERFNWKQAFEKLVCRHANGSTSPFGVEVTE